MAFQIVDDVLDVVATDEALGKPSGHDMVEGTYTLPVLRVLNGARSKAPLGRGRRRPEGPAGRAACRTPTGRPCGPGAGRRRRRAVVDPRRPAATPTGPSPPWARDAATDAGQWLVATANGLLEKVEAEARWPAGRTTASWRTWPPPRCSKAAPSAPTAPATARPKTHAAQPRTPSTPRHGRGILGSQGPARLVTVTPGALDGPPLPW